LFTGLGLATTTILGPFGVVRWIEPVGERLNLRHLRDLRMSLLGAFEITIPSFILTS